MFGIDDFALWFGWYFVTDLAQSPATQRLVEKAESAISDNSGVIKVDDPQHLLDWLETSGKMPAAGRNPPAK